MNELGQILALLRPCSLFCVGRHLEPMRTSDRAGLRFSRVPLRPILSEGPKNAVSKMSVKAARCCWCSACQCVFHRESDSPKPFCCASTVQVRNGHAWISGRQSCCGGSDPFALRMCAAPGERRNRVFDGLQEDRSVKRLAQIRARTSGKAGFLCAGFVVPGDHHHRHACTDRGQVLLIFRPLISGICTSSTRQSGVC